MVREQLRRLARPGRATVTVEAVPGDVDGLRWRTRVRYVALPDGRRGMRKHRSHDVVPVDDCLIAARRRAAGPSSRPVAAAGHVRRRRRRLLAGAPGRARRCWSRRCWTLLRPAAGGAGARPLRRRRAVRRLPGRRGRRPRRGGRRRGRRHGVRARPSATCGDRRAGGARGPVDRVLAADDVRARPTWSSSTRRARAPSAGSWSRSWPARRAPWPTSPATRRRWPATSRSSPSTATALQRPAGVRPVPDDPPRRVRRAARACLRRSDTAGADGVVLGEQGGRRARARPDREEAVRPRQRLGRGRSRRADDAERATSSGTPGRSTPPGTSASPRAPTTRPRPGYAFVCGDFRRVHRTALIACVYRASEWRHKEVELAAHDLLQHLDRDARHRAVPLARLLDVMYLDIKRLCRSGEAVRPRLALLPRAHGRRQDGHGARATDRRGDG